MFSLKIINDLKADIDTAFSGLVLPENPQGLYDPIRYMMGLDGKRFRPLMLVLACKSFANDHQRALHAAVSIELFHNFTLLHDDIMDNAPLRRGKPTVFFDKGLNSALLSGDALFTIALLELLKTKYEDIKELLDVFLKTSVEVCEGQQLDIDFENRDNVVIDEYIEMIRLKTSVLLGCSMYCGAKIGSAPNEIAQQLYNFGVNIGIAFQIQDDYLDVFGDKEVFGKQRGGDIIANKKTILNLKAFEMASEVQKENLQLYSHAIIGISSEEKVATVTQLFKDIGVDNEIRNYINHYKKLALQDLSNAKTCMNEDAYEAFVAIADYLVTRNV